MKLKIFIIFISVLTLSQIYLYKEMLESNEQKWKIAIKELDGQISIRNNDIVATELSIQVMKKNMETIPDTIIKGVEDPEKKYLDFLDYIDKSELESMQGSYAISAKPIIKYKPVPLQQTDFAIQFQFMNAQKLESVFGYLLDQQRDYPLKVNRLEIVRVPGNKPKVNLDVSLLLPAKIIGSPVSQDVGRKSIDS